MPFFFFQTNMFKLAVFAALFSFCYGASIRIVNGTDASEGEFPYAVSLRNEARHTCGATIIDERHALTAAHCVCDGNRPLNPALYSIQYGSVHISATFERSVPVVRIVCNDFSMQTLINDAAVLELAFPIPRDYPWEPVPLSRHFDTSVGHTGIIIGWGRLWADGPIPSILQKLEVEVYPDNICGWNFDIRHHVCFGAPIGGACNGDSGTALIVDGEQVAIASFITTTCGTANQTHPNVYSKVTASIDFIDNVVNHPQNQPK